MKVVGDNMLDLAGNIVKTRNYLNESRSLWIWV